MMLKIGDKVRGKDYTGRWKWTGTIIEIGTRGNNYTPEDAVWAYWVRDDRVYEDIREDKSNKIPTYLRSSLVELISSPFQLEVGKTYVDGNGNKYYVIGIDVTDTREDNYILVCGGTLQHYTKDGRYIRVMRRNQELENIVAEYIPPPPEEWRALFFNGPKGKPEISTAYFDNETDAVNCFKGVPNFMYAIRTDINAKKEN